MTQNVSLFKLPSLARALNVLLLHNLEVDTRRVLLYEDGL